MSGEAGFTRSWAVGHRLVTMTAQKPAAGGVQSVAVEWQPDMPERLTAAELAEYRTGRNRAVREFAEHFGRKAVVVELP